MSSAPLSFRPPPPDSATFLPPSVPLRGPETPWSRAPLPASPLRLMTDRGDGPIGSLPEHLLVEILTRLPTHEWVQISCVSKHWASLFRGEYLWQTAIARKWPSAGFRKRWPGPIPRGSARRRFQALYVSENLVPSGGEIDELVGHTYLYLKEQLERVAVPPSSILHGTIIDQFIACGRTGEKAHELASNIWIAVIDNLEENQQTFMLLKHLAQEGDVAVLADTGVSCSICSFSFHFHIRGRIKYCGGCSTSCSPTSVTVSAGQITMRR